MMLTGIKECQVPEIRANLIRMIGILALLLVNNLNEATSNVICTITEFILDQALKENEVWVLSEALDTIVDLYSEDETDLLAAKVKLVEKLTVLAPILKNKVNRTLFNFSDFNSSCVSFLTYIVDQSTYSFSLLQELLF